MFYLFNQNNSFGKFDVNNKLCHSLYIEADSESEAIEIAEGLGCYWDGVDKGIDCPCCGDRWSNTWIEKIDTKQDSIKYGELEFDNLENYAQYFADFYNLTTPEARIYYKDGTTKEIFARKKTTPKTDVVIKTVPASQILS